MKNAKKFLGLAMVLLMVLSLAPMAVYADNTGNLLTNGGFETVTEGSWPDNWDIPTGKNYNGTEKGTEALVTSAVQHSGTYALQVIPSSEENRRVCQKVENLTPGAFYEASAWVLVTGDTLTSSKGADLLVLPTHSSGLEARWGGTTPSTSFNVITTNSKWTKMTACWQQRADETVAYVAFDIGKMSSGVESVCYFDDAAVREITGYAGGFATGFETVSTEKLDSETTIDLPRDVSFLNRTDKVFGAFAGEVSASKEATHSGEYALKLIPNATGRRALLYVPNLTAGKTYKLTAYVKVTADLTAGANILVGSGVSGSDDAKWKKWSAQKTATDWMKIETAFTVVDDYNYAYIEFYSGKSSEGSAVTYFDDVTIEETNVKFTDAAGAAFGETLSAAGTVTAKATVAGAQGDVARVIVGVYDTVDGTPCLANVYVSDSIKLLAAKWREITIEDISLAAGQYAKAVVLDGAAGLKPLAEAKQLTVVSAS